MFIRATQVSPRSAPPAAQLSRPGRVLGALSGALTLAALATLLVCAPTYAADSSTTCTKFASPLGADTNSGSASAPFRTAQALAKSLSTGQVGCLHAGTYAGGVTFSHGGAAGAALVLRSYPGEQALITGRVWVGQGSNYVTIADLSLDGSHQPNEGTLPSPTVNANDVTFEADDVTNEHTAICFLLGSPAYGAADSTVISGNRIHDCGVLPAMNHQHGIYVEDATNTQIVGNLIDHNADRAIQFYPYAAGSTVTDNVIAENGEGIDFSGAEGVASNDNTVEGNLFVNQLIRHDIESWYPEDNPVGSGNVAQNNCVSSGGIDTSAGGFTATGNVTVAAGDVVTAGSGYRAVTGSACARLIPSLAGALATGNPAEGSGTTLAPAPMSTPAPVPVPTPISTPKPISTPTPVSTPTPTRTPTLTQTPTHHQRLRTRTVSGAHIATARTRAHRSQRKARARRARRKHRTHIFR